MRLTAAPWKVRALSVEEMLILAALYCLTPLIDEIRATNPRILDLMVVQRTLARELAKRSGLELGEVLAVLVALEHKGLIASERPQLETATR